MLNKTILLDDDIPVMSFIRATGDTVKSWFQPNPVTSRKTGICKFAKEHNVRCFRARKVSNGLTRISVITKDGKEVFALGRNFSSAFLELVYKFNN